MSIKPEKLGNEDKHTEIIRLEHLLFVLCYDPAAIYAWIIRADELSALFSLCFPSSFSYFENDSAVI